MRDPLTNKMFGATLLSGVLSGITLLMVPGALFVGPGVLFGLATAWVFITIKWLDIVQSFIWLIASTGAWYAAMRVYSAHGIYDGSNDPVSSMLQAGLVGSLILALALSLLVRRIRLTSIAVTVALSLAMAAVMYAILNYGTATSLGGSSENVSYIRLAAAFAIWQVGVGLSLLTYKVISREQSKPTRLKGPSFKARLKSYYVAIGAIVVISIVAVALSQWLAVANSPGPGRVTSAGLNSTPQPSVCDYQNDTVGCGLNSFKVLVPVAGQQFCLGSTVDIKWAAPSDMQTVTVLVAEDSSSAPQSTIGVFPANQHQYKWTLSGYPPAAVYQIWLNSDYKGYSVNAVSTGLITFKDCGSG